MPELFKRIESTGIGQPDEAAPAYDDVIHLHGPAHGFAHSSSSGYAAVPQTDVEHDAPTHDHHGLAPSTQQRPQETLAQTIAGVFRPKPHVHCEECDRQTERRERREAKRHCCAMVASVFMVLFLCGMILGIVITNAAARRAKLHHG
ncbi:hypothetical protein DPSP01_007349 [Paraphaeosphaeria sporulosa]|uniref:Uncharacterized protein n=1 Tax=Paraphaeosphaeria sporulosa TaxID=1460663 RepID=A0A177C6R1_9PLEO|nr:uncharacterized protein CC84DRAFT_1178397 [Paraphaeosphaeria sporulosa]OAG02811.1 hypothetical protein CC84DRAFT_1178397 [Paraphaeosphaeria sporulosa]